MAGAALTAGTVIGLTGLAAGSARADNPATISLTSVNTFQQPVIGTQTQTEWEAVFSVTCPAGEGASIKTIVSQVAVMGGSPSYAFACTGSAETIDVTIFDTASEYPGVFGAGSVSVSAELYVASIFGHDGAGHIILGSGSWVAGFAQQSINVD